MTSIVKKIPLELVDVVLSETSLSIANAEGFRHAGAALLAMDKCYQWWWGDYLLYGEKYSLPGVLEGSRKSLRVSTIWSFMEIARFYPPSDRVASLTFTHHRDIRYILGPAAGLKEAKKWLAKAASNDWTCGDLREAMRTNDGDPGPMRGAVSISDFVRLSRSISEINPEEITFEQREELRESTQPLWKFLCTIHRAQFSIAPQGAIR